MRRTIMASIFRNSSFVFVFSRIDKPFTKSVNKTSLRSTPASNLFNNFAILLKTFKVRGFFVSCSSLFVFDALEGLFVGGEVDAVFFFELKYDVVDQTVVEVVTTQKSVTVGAFDFEDAVA